MRQKVEKECEQANTGIITALSSKCVCVFKRSGLNSEDGTATGMCVYRVNCTEGHLFVCQPGLAVCQPGLVVCQPGLAVWECVSPV